MYSDTIAAIATPLAEAALGMVRLSGPDAQSIARRVFSGRLEDRRVAHGWLRDPTSGEVVDEAMAVFMAAPRTYTREDMVEFTCHGGPLPPQRTLEILLHQGARPANPGEFTLRAFLNGRLDLAQAEAVLDVVQARTRPGLQLALQGLEGRLSREVRRLREALMDPLALLTAQVAFPEDEVEGPDVVQPLQAALGEVQRLIATADQGMVYRQGVRTAIAGPPNAGKSSLLNRLLGQGRAIVTPIAGTTRDTIEETANIRGIPFLLIDTAGIVETDDPIEREGIRRSHAVIGAADLVLLVIDASLPPAQQEAETLRGLAGSRVLVVANKRDLLPGSQEEVPPGRAPDGRPAVLVSALTGEGMDALEQRMAELALGCGPAPMDALVVSSPRHRAALERAADHLAAALGSLDAQMPADFVTIDLTAAVAALGEITGETVQEDLLDRIFSRFCIGK